MKYICTQCTGRSGEEHTFQPDREPSHCPWCGTTRHIETIESYLRSKVADAQMEADRWEEEYQALKNERNS